MPFLFWQSPVALDSHLRFHSQSNDNLSPNTIAFVLTLASFTSPSALHPTESTAPAETSIVQSAQATLQAAVSTLVDPPRVKMTTTGYTRTLRHADGQLIRGISVPSYKYLRDIGESKYLKDPRYWDALQASGINAVRLVAFDAWQRSHGDPGTFKPYPFTNLDDPKQRAEMLAEFDLIIDEASRRGMLVMLNYHDTGNYLDPDFTQPVAPDGRFPRAKTWNYVYRFWNLVAPRYANRTHVFYELLNEPVAWSADDYKAEDVRRFKALFDLVRSRAPNTHIVVLSFASHISPTARTPRVVGLEMERAGINFSNASLGIHPYNSYFPANNVSAPMLDLMTHFTVVNTEQNFPAGMLRDSSDPDARGMDGDRLGVQSMERLHTSWFHWNVDSPRDFRAYFNGIVVRDAKIKGYYWKQ